MADNRGMAAAGESKSHPACRNSSNPYHECSEYCFRVIAEQRSAGGDAAEGKVSFSLKPVFFFCFTCLCRSRGFSLGFEEKHRGLIFIFFGSGCFLRV